MAFCVNNENVLMYCVVKSDQILLIRQSILSECLVESYSLNWPSSKSQDTKSSNVNHVKEHLVISAAVSNCGKFLAACDSNNILHLWKYEASAWNHKCKRQLVRKSQKIIFTNSGSELIVADRGGDVFVYSVSDALKEGKFLLGHISLVIDISISSDDNYLLTCDRDGKIRVSCFPNCYNIHSYCLGHEEFVSSVQSITLSQELILSSSGDGTIRLWNYNGDIICWVNLFENEVLCKNLESSEDCEDAKPALSCLLDEKQTIFAVKNVRYSPKHTVCAILFYSVKGIAIYSIKENAFEFNQFIPLESIPFDAVFDLLGNLIVLQKSNSKQYSCFACKEEKDVHFNEVTIENALCEELRKLCENIDDLNEVQDNCDTLFKRNFDDKEDYSENRKNNSKKSKIA